jgi:prolyl oligopeptidase
MARVTRSCSRFFLFALAIGAPLACASRVPRVAAPAPVSAPAHAAAAPAHGASSGEGADGVVEELHGVKVADPFRWLEDGDSPRVKAWQRAESEKSRRALDAIPGRATLAEEARAVVNADRAIEAPRVRRSTTGKALYFHVRRPDGADQSSLFVREGLKGEDRVLLDPAHLAGDATAALDWWYPSNDGALLAYGTSVGGTELSTLHVRDVKAGTDLPDAIPFTRYATVAWVQDDKGFYYVHFPEPGTVPAGEEQQHAKIFFHRLGHDWRRDRPVFEPADKDDHPAVKISPGGRWLVAEVEKGTLRSDIYVRDRSKGDAAPWVPVIVGADSVSQAFPREGRLYVLTNEGAPNGRLFSVEYDHPARSLWREVLPEKKEPLASVTILRSFIAATYLHDAASRIERFTLNGKSLGAISLPVLGTAETTGPWDADDLFVRLDSFVVPPEVLSVDARTGKTEPWDHAGEVPGVADVETTLLHATSKDGTKVPVFVVAKKGLARDGSAAALVWGYGGFSVNQTPSFRAYAPLVAAHGGVFALAVLRGGAEFGEAWHRAGMLGKKQNVFDDYAAAAEELVKEKIASPERLGSIGRSNGGLLVAAAITEHPELFRAAVSIVPLTDMLRYPRFRIGRWWVSEYGDPDKDDAFAWLYAYSPYHHVTQGTHYPATLVSTGESDNRVDPMHARKMAARLEEAQGDTSRPILLRVDTGAGHGQGKPASKLAEEVADELAFAFHELGITM